MTNYEILKLYKEGKMTKAEVKKKLIEAKNSSFSNIIYLNSVWKKADLDKSLCNDKVENIIVFCENEKQIVIEGYNQINVYKGSGFQKKNDREYVCDPCDRSQVARICKELVGKNNYMIYLWSEPDLLLGSESLFLLFQILMKQGAAKSCRVVMLYDNKNRSCEAFGGFAKSISIENPNVRLHTVSIPKTAKISEVAKSEILYFNDKETEIKYEHNKRYVKELELIENTSRNNANISYQDKTYLITGGAGGLGLIFAKYLSQKGAGKVILTGRSKKSISDDILSVMKKNNTELVYQQLDVCDSSAVQEFVKTLDSKSIAIDGIIHSAGVLRDSYMIKKELADFQAVLKPKVEGVNHLYHAFKDKSLDFFVTFSSIVGVLGNAGQADYATANSYMDNFMQYVTKQNKNWIRAVSINWPFWDNGGMQLSEDNLKYMEQKYGLYPISHKDGLSAFDFSILNNESQVIVINGNPEILSSYISCLKTDKITVTQKKQEIKSSAVSDEVLKKKVADLLKKLIAKETKMKAERISIQVPIEKYGLDSVMMMSISNELETVFGSLRKTLLFEYITIDKLSDYFVEEHRDSIIQKMLSPTENTNTLEAVEPENKVIQTVEDTFYDHREKDSESDDIAIIGLAGKYPMADDYEKLWENLCIGKDCITTVPKDRWDVRPNKKEWGGFINDVDKFDPLLFDMSYKEAALVDPAERIFMENVWSALEDAANTKRRLADKNVGVFVGAMYAQYQFYGVEDYNSEDAKPLNSSLSSIANRISYFF
jgi:NADP-dependent 3-hydroxy acid dehydrogenase YdfG/acyl carrier protein